VRDDEKPLTGRIVELAAVYGRCGTPRVTALLRAEEWTVNHKRAERIWHHSGLKVPAKQPITQCFIQLARWPTLPVQASARLDLGRQSGLVLANSLVSLNDVLNRALGVYALPLAGRAVDQSGTWPPKGLLMQQQVASSRATLSAGLELRGPFLRFCIGYPVSAAAGLGDAVSRLAQPGLIIRPLLRPEICGDCRQNTEHA